MSIDHDGCVPARVQIHRFNEAAARRIVRPPDAKIVPVAVGAVNLVTLPAIADFGVRLAAAVCHAHSAGCGAATRFAARYSSTMRR